MDTTREMTPGMRPDPDLRQSSGMSPPLSEQTPGLDKTSAVRRAALRGVTYVRSHRRLFGGILAGLAVVSVARRLLPHRH
jgi:hypothetical protein